MRQNFLFNMSLSGNMVFILYILTYPLTKRFFSLEWRYRILKIAIAFYLIPISLCKYFILNVLRRCFPLLWEKISHIIVNMDSKYIIIVSQDFMKLSSRVCYMLVVFLIIAIVAFTIIREQTIQYRKWKSVCMIGSEKPTNMEQEIFYKIKNEMGIKKKVELICSEYCTSPMTSGILSSILILPRRAEKTNENNYEYMLRHELVHIKHHDLLIKYIGLLVLAVHWYNPFVYIMFHEISVISEMYCDSIVIGGKGEEECRKYGDLILKLAVQNKFANKRQFFIGMTDSRDKWVYKRRILEMKRAKKYKAVLPVVMTIVICVAGGITTFAYDSPQIIYTDTGYDFDADADFSIETAEECTALPSDYFFAADNGKIYDLSKVEENSRILCNHDFSIHGTLNEHKKDGNGGCVIKSYEAWICSICSAVKTGELKSTVTYKPCPH